MTVNNMVKTAHGASVTRIYSTQTDRLVERGLQYPDRQAGGARLIRFPEGRRNTGQCFRVWSAAETADRVDCNITVVSKFVRKPVF